MADFTQHPLTLEAERLLETSGFETARVALAESDAAVLVAEDRYSVAAILGADEWGAVGQQLGAMATDFANWALSRNPRDKQWDLYFVLLLAQPVIDNAELVEIEDVAADTRYLRRLIRHGVSAESALPDVRTALAALLPLALPARVTDRDPYRAMVDALRSQGIDSETAEQTVQRFIDRRGRD